MYILQDFVGRQRTGDDIWYFAGKARIFKAFRRKKCLILQENMRIIKLHFTEFKGNKRGESSCLIYRRRPYLEGGTLFLPMTHIGLG